MAEPGEKDERTEQASPQKLDRMREEGRAPRSADVGAAAALAAGTMALGLFGATAASRIESFTRRALALRDARAPLGLLGAMVRELASIAVPIVALVAIAALVAGLIQTRGLVTFGEVAPKLERLDPIAGLRRVLPGPEVAAEIGKTLLKVLVLGALAWWVLAGAVPRLVVLAHAPAAAGAEEARRIVARLLVQSCLAFVAIAAADYVLAYRRFHGDAKMSKQEQKDEHKEQEGDPHVKARRRARARQLARQRSVTEVKNATVLVTNPTHYAVALRYVPGRDAAPVLTAKGQDEIALRMREEARRHRVPVIENRPLARAMHATGQVGRPIPVELYEAVAGVIAHVMRLRGAR